MEGINKRTTMKKYKEEKVTFSDGSYQIRYTKQYHDCFCCKRKTHISRIRVLQNDLFTNTIVTKKACEICYKKANEILEQAKPQLLATSWYRK